MTISEGLIRFQTPVCVCCGKASEIILDRRSFIEWTDGKLIQEAFPALSPNDRELMVSGTHPKCWDELVEADE